MRILTQGSTGAIGDFFISTHVMYHFHTRGHEVHAALPQERSSDLTLELYRRAAFFKSVLLLNQEEWDNFPTYCRQSGFEPHLYLRSIYMERGIQPHALEEWFDLSDCNPTVEGNNHVIVHVASASNYERPKVPNLELWLNHIHDAQLVPLFIGGEKDVSPFQAAYPTIYEQYASEECWRIGKDSLWQSIGNIRSSFATLVFSSWSSIVASLSGRYTIEMWNHEQVLYYGSVIKYYLGSPVCLIQIPFTYDPPHNYFAHPIKKEMDLRAKTWQ